MMVSAFAAFNHLYLPFLVVFLFSYHPGVKNMSNRKISQFMPVISAGLMIIIVLRFKSQVQHHLV
jgi:hypothetical protein